MRRTFTLGALAIINLAAGLLTQWLVFSVLGIGRHTDAFVAALALPQTLLTVVSSPLANVLIPMFAGLSPDEADRGASSTALAMASLTVPGVVLLYVTAPWWAAWIVPAFDAASTELVIRMARIQVLGLLVATQHGVLWALAQARHRFVWTEGGLAVASLISLFAVAPVAHQWGIEGVAWLFALRSGLRVIALIPGARIRPTLRFHRQHVREVTRRIAPLVASSTYYKTEHLIDRFLASMAPPGALSVLNLAQLLLNSAVGILTNALIVPVSPRLGELARADRKAAFVTLLRRKALLGLATSSASLAGLALLGLPLLRLAVGLGGVTEQNVMEIWMLALALGGTLVGPVFGLVLNHGFYALGETRRLSALSATSYTVGLGLKVGGFMLAGLYGLALGTSAYFALSAVLIAFTLSHLLHRWSAREDDAPGENTCSRTSRPTA